MKNITLTDLARMLSLNPSTVSRALSDHPDISDETRLRVQNAANEFKYRPNLRARFFRKKKSGLVALILPEINTFFVPKMIEGINEVLSTAGFSTIIFCSEKNLDKEKTLLDHCLSWAVEGIIISLSDFSIDDTHLMVAKEAGIPVILLDKIVPSEVFSSISIDDYEASYLAINHLIAHNKCRILGIFNNPEQENSKQRVNGMQNALTSAGIEWSPHNLLFYTPQASEFATRLENAYKSDAYDAVFIMSDELLLLSYAVFLKLGVLPGHLSLVAISDGTLPLMLTPKITHVRHSGFEMGQMAGRELLNGINVEKHQATAHKISPGLISLESVNPG
jgi:LacI family transcriptional regulator